MFFKRIKQKYNLNKCKMNNPKNNIGAFLITIILFSVFIFFSFRIFTTDYDAKNETIPKIYDKDTVSENITVTEAHEMINANLGNPNFILLDVRTPEEYNSGHIAKSFLIDFRSDTFKEELKELDKNNTYLIYCRTGSRSATTLNTMKELGFNNAYNMLGGITLWEKESYSDRKIIVNSNHAFLKTLKNYTEEYFTLFHSITIFNF